MESLGDLDMLPVVIVTLGLGFVWTSDRLSLRAKVALTVLAVGLAGAAIYAIVWSLT